MGVEIELKLVPVSLTPSRVGRLAVLKEHAVGTARRLQLENEYYDTPDQALRGRGLMLRVRKVGRRFVQTLKTDGVMATGLVQRGEWEVAVRGATADLTAFKDPEAVEALKGIASGDLGVAYKSSVTRRVSELAWPSGDDLATIELALDEGVISAGTDHDPIAEIEFELRAGRPESLYEMALALNAVTPLRLEPRSKGERGFLLAAGSPPPWRRAAKMELHPDMRVDEALEGILRGCLGHWTANIAAARDGRHPEGVHQLRVALRRLRSALTLMGAALDPSQREWIGAGCRWLLGSLGKARDWDVFLKDLLPPVTDSDAEGRDAALAGLHGIAKGERDAGYDDVRAALDSAQHTELWLRLAHWLERRGWRERAGREVQELQGESVGVLARGVLEKRHNQVRKRGRRFNEMDAEARHELRIAFKKLRYGTEFFAALFPGREMERYLKRLAAMQEVLGRLNDVSAADRLLRDRTAGAGASGQVEIAYAAGEVVGWLRRSSRGLEHEAREEWKAFADAEPFWR